MSGWGFMPVLLALSAGILFTGWLASKFLSEEQQRDPRLSIALIAGVWLSVVILSILLILTGSDR